MAATPTTVCAPTEHTVGRITATKCDTCGADLCEICLSGEHRTDQGHDLDDPRYWGV